MPFVYHYHATNEISPGRVQHHSGILTCEKRVDSIERYRSIKAAIAGDAVDPNRLTICSLTLLHETPGGPESRSNG